MHGLVDAGHPPAAQAVENLVLIDEESVRVPLGDQGRLVFRDVLLCDQPACKGRQVVRSAAGVLEPAVVQDFDIVRGQQLAFDEQAADVLHGEFHTILRGIWTPTNQGVPPSIMSGPARTAPSWLARSSFQESWPWLTNPKKPT